MTALPVKRGGPRLRGLGAALAIIGTVMAALLGYLIWRGEEPGGIDDVYTAMFGPPDLGGVDFETLSRSSRPNDALACPADICQRTAIDIVTPVYPVTGEMLRQIVKDVGAQMERTRNVYSGRWEDEERFIVRSNVMRFPDTLTAQIFGAGPGQSRLAIYSRSQIGYSDLGVNRRRVEDWLAAIEARLAARSAAGRTTP